MPTLGNYHVLIDRHYSMTDLGSLIGTADIYARYCLDFRYPCSFTLVLLPTQPLSRLTLIHIAPIPF